MSCCFEREAGSAERGMVNPARSDRRPPAQGARLKRAASLLVGTVIARSKAKVAADASFPAPHSPFPASASASV